MLRTLSGAFRDRAFFVTVGIDPVRILLVEDDPRVASYLLDMLEDADFEVDGPYDSLSDGMAAVADHMPDAAILDIGLKDRDVYLLANDLEQYGVPFVLCSGMPPEGRMTRFGNHPFIAKDKAKKHLIPTLRDELH
jgi:CheY-like chemotaxis protein